MVTSLRMPPKMPGQKKKKTASSDEMSIPVLMEGISSLHSWVKANTMIRPTKLGKNRVEGEEGSDDEDTTVMLLLTSQNPNDPKSLLKWSLHDQSFNSVKLEETMIDHFVIDSKIVFAETKDAIEQIAKFGIPAESDETEEEKAEREEKEIHCKKSMEREKEKMKKENTDDEEEDPGKMNPNNQFAFIERASQTKVREMQSIESQTDPPPVASYGSSISPSILHDFFTKNEKAMNEDNAENKEESTDMTPGEQNVEKKMVVSAKIIERLINLNTFDDIARDYRFYEDPSDEFRDPEGSFLPLWQFLFEAAAGLEVTSLQWSPRYKDLFAVSYGSFDFYKQAGPGFLCLFSLKNPSYPEYLCRTHCGIMSLDIHPTHTHMVAVGLYDGNVAVFDLRSKEPRASYLSSPSNGKHRDVAWQVRWGEDNLDGYPNFYSISGDGRVTNWTLVKTALWCTDKLLLEYTQPLHQSDELEEHLREGVRAIAFKPDEQHLFLVGTEEGGIYLATTEYSSTQLMAYTAYNTPVNSLMWNTYHPAIFISCAAEFVVHIFHKDHSTAIMRFDLGAQVGQVAWAPYSSTVFCAVTQEGKVILYDLDINKYKPICSQKVVSYKVGHLNSIAFNNVEPLVILGDSSGVVHSLKISPNLRKKPKSKAAEEAIKNDDVKALYKEEVIKLTKILAQVVPSGSEEDESFQ